MDAIDGFRAAALKEHFDVRETAIPRVLSDLNRLLLASPKRLLAAREIGTRERKRESESIPGEITR